MLEGLDTECCAGMLASRVLALDYIVLQGCPQLERYVSYRCGSVILADEVSYTYQPWICLGRVGLLYRVGHLAASAD